jgi:hypothetical protein
MQLPGIGMYQRIIAHYDVKIVNGLINTERKNRSNNNVTHSGIFLGTTSQVIPHSSG